MDFKMKILLLSLTLLLSACGEESSNEEERGNEEQGAETYSVLGKWQNGYASIEINPTYVTITNNGQGYKYRTTAVAPSLVFSSLNGQFNFKCDYTVGSQLLRTSNCFLNGKAKAYYGPISAEAQTLNSLEGNWNKVF